MERETDSSARTLAAAAHASGIFFPFLGPIVTFVIGRKSAFVRRHALQALIGTLLLDGFLLVLGTISLAYSIYSLYQHYQENWENFNIWHVVLRSAITWICVGLIGVCNTILNALQAMKAYNGEQPKRGLAAKLANRLAGTDDRTLGVQARPVNSES